jgi:hypothetical protein
MRLKELIWPKNKGSRSGSFVMMISVAGRESGAGNPLATDFTLVGQKLEQLGFVYYRGFVSI